VLAAARSARWWPPRAPRAWARSTRCTRSRAVRERYGVRVHVDAALRRVLTLLADGRPVGWPRRRGGRSRVRLGRRRPAQARPAALRVRRGAVPRPVVGRFYLHDSPYTYFTSDELHLGEISLECSRAGAAAAALWLTSGCCRRTPDGLGEVLAAGRRAALDWAGLLAAGDGPLPRPASAVSAAGAGHRHLLPGPGVRCPLRRPSARVLEAAWPTQSTRYSSARCGSPRTRSPGATLRSAPTPAGQGSCAAC
jgi:hypothetical protein